MGNSIFEFQHNKRSTVVATHVQGTTKVIIRFSVVVCISILVLMKMIATLKLGAFLIGQKRQTRFHDHALSFD